MPRESSKVRRKVATAVHVPDLKEDAAERKRVLNVLAQRRYRERRREHLKKLESHLDNSTSPPAGNTKDELNDTTYDRLNGAHIDSPFAPYPSVELPAQGFATSDSLTAGIEAPEVASNGWATSFDTSVPDWPAATLLPSLFPVSKSTPSSNIPTPEQTNTSTSPSSLGSIDWPPVDEMDVSSALQAMSTRSYTFPDERHTSILELKLLRGCMMIAKRMSIEDILWSLDSTSPFTDPALSGLSFDHLPANLRPTANQKLIPHHPVLDILAWPTVRDKMILVFSQPPEVRPPIAASPMALIDFVYDVEDSAEGVRIWGDDPYDAENWEAGEAVFKKWWWALDSSIIGKSNDWRKERGAPLLGAGEGFVVGEV